MDDQIGFHIPRSGLLELGPICVMLAVVRPVSIPTLVMLGCAAVVTVPAVVAVEAFPARAPVNVGATTEVPKYPVRGRFVAGAPKSHVLSVFHVRFPAPIVRLVNVPTLVMLG